MSAAITSWKQLGLRDLFYAYRKAKADCFFERSLYVSQIFAQFELQAPNLLSDLLTRLQNGEIDQILTEHRGTPRVVAKKLSITVSNRSKSNSHSYFSDPNRAFEQMCASHELIPEFRIVGHFPVEMHILSALWINLVGHKFDAVLSRDCYGSRLRRYRPPADAPSGTVGEYHIDAIGSFQQYFAPYRAWRGRGMDAIRRELEADRAVIALTLDLTSYYHMIDPSFLSSSAFLKDAGIELDDWQLAFTRSLTEALANWSSLVHEKLLANGCDPKHALLGGLPIGLSMVRLASNVLLAGLDRDIHEGLAPVYYGRYVDDIFVVMRDPGNIQNGDQLLRYLSARTRHFPRKAKSTGEIYLKLPKTFSGNTKLLLQQTKQKLFFLKGRGGLDLLDNVDSELRRVSSERRLMPSPDRLAKTTSAQVLAAANDGAQEADTLRRADGLSVRRLGWSIQLRSVETLSRDLRPADWVRERQQFYEFAHDHILRPDRILDQVDYLPRLLSLAVALMDWSAARRLFDGAMAALSQLHKANCVRTIKLNGYQTNPNEVLWEDLKKSITDSAADAIARSLRWNGSTGGMRSLSETALSLCDAVGLGNDPAEIERMSVLLRESDWSKTSYKHHLQREAKRQRPFVENEELLYGLSPNFGNLKDFIERTSPRDSDSATARIGQTCVLTPVPPGISLLPYLFPTRPYTSQEISLFLPSLCVFGERKKGAMNLAKFVRAVRGVWVWPNLQDNELDEAVDDGDAEPPSCLQANLGSSQKKKKVLLGISSLWTSDLSFSSAAGGKPDLSRERYARVETIVNEAINARPRPEYLLLPELSLPERWIDTVSRLLADSGINLIAGLDYHLMSRQHIYSDTVLVLRDQRLGFPSSVQIRQSKSLPAPAEERTLLEKFGRTWLPSLKNELKPTYSHDGFCFGLLVCSELQNMKHRLGFQGSVDSLMVLSWNQDLDTFSALVESGSLDVHAYIALVNNRRYGDSRVRSPAKESYRRDLCRLRGGENEHLVVVELEIDALRQFQSRDRRWPNDGDQYKPVPEGFIISPSRKCIPI